MITRSRGLRWSWVVGIFRVRVIARQQLAVRARTQCAATVRLGLRATAAPRLVSTPEMDVQMRVGHWGPVTATLDWCEVRYLQLRVYYASDLPHSPIFQRPIISFLITWPKSPTRSPIFSSSAYLYTAHVYHRRNLYLLGISWDLLFVFFLRAAASSVTVLSLLIFIFIEIFCRGVL